MDLPDSLVIWARSIEPLAERMGATLTFDRSPRGRLKCSAWVSIVYGEKWAELLVWESGEAELASSEDALDGQEHFDGLTPERLSDLLSRVLDILV